MNLPPWQEIAQPRNDIADGSFDESLFAADLGLVDRGRGPTDYLDPVSFCEKTYLTDNLQSFLGELASRLDGGMAAPAVFRLQTEFGGGKTHTLLAAYHLFREPARVAGTDFVTELAKQTGRTAFPKAKVVVLEGGALAAGQPDPDISEVEVRTLLGELAYRLGGASAFAQVADQDHRLLGSSTTQLATLLEAHAPCLILLDETLQYLTKALAVPTHEGNLAATALTFIKELCTAVASVPRAAVVATLTSSNLEDYASVTGEGLQERLSKVVGRTENVITPVEGDDIFPILHRRLFSTVGDRAERRQVADAYADYYETLGDAVPPSYRETSYRERLAAAYPFHPELVDILTNRWGSLSGFQRTRGALRTLAHTVKALCQRHNRQTLILSGDVDLADEKIRGEVLRFAGESYKAALNADIIRSDAKAPEEDRRRGGQVEELHLATRLATTAFLNSFGSDRVLGASAAQLLIGVGRPGLSRGLIEDVRDSLEGLLWYMRLEGGRYRFTTEPNLNKVVLEREGAITDARIEVLLRDAISKQVPTRGALRVEPRITSSTDLPDVPQLILGVVDFDHQIGPGRSDETLRFAREVLEHHGNAWRTNRNAGLLIAGDAPTVAKARATARTLAALSDLKDDRRRLGRFNAEQREQLDKRLANAEERLPQQIVMAYRHLLILGGGSDEGAVSLDHLDLGPSGGATTVTDRLLDYLRSADRLVETTLAPAALLATRFGLLPAGTDSVELDHLLGFFYRLPRLPKLASPDVLRSALADGVTKGLFGLSSGASWNAPDAVVRFAEPQDPAEIEFQAGTWLVRASEAKTLKARQFGPTTTTTTGPTDDDPQRGGTTNGGGRGLDETSTSSATVPSVTLAVRGVPASKAREFVKVAVLPLVAASSDVELEVIIRADGGLTGIPKDTLNLVVLEGLRQLGITQVDLQ